MSITDPLLKHLKGIVLELRTQGEAVYDASSNLLRLCKLLEEIFRKGLKNPGWFGKSDYWTWISKLPNIYKQRCNPLFSIVVDTVRDSKKVCTTCGRGRLFIRSALEKKVLAVPIQVIAKDFKLANEWYTEDSILGNDILVEILQSLLFELTEVTFHLKIRNSAFLDCGWDIPVHRKYELVPCEDMGLHVQMVRGYLVIVGVEPGSVADEHGQLCVGDVIDELFNQPVKGISLAAVHSLLDKHKNLPVHLHVSKLYDEEGNICTIIAELLQELNIIPQKGKTPLPCWDDASRDLENNKTPAHAILEEEEDKELPVQGSDVGAEYDAFYVGCSIIGHDGRVQRIEDGVLSVIQQSHTSKGVKLDLQEKEIIVMDKETNEVIMQHSYTSISACGRRTDQMLYVGYLAGETTCSLAKEFKCHVYKLEDEETARIVLCAIAQGFQRTHLLL